MRRDSDDEAADALRQTSFDHCYESTQKRNKKKRREAKDAPKTRTISMHTAFCALRLETMALRYQYKYIPKLSCARCSWRGVDQPAPADTPIERALALFIRNACVKRRKRERERAHKAFGVCCGIFLESARARRVVFF